MSFDHDYPNRKDHRKPYKPWSGPAVCRSCRNNGGCHVCAGNRLHKHERRAPADDPEGDEAILWDMRYLADEYYEDERLPMFFDDECDIGFWGDDL